MKDRFDTSTAIIRTLIISLFLMVLFATGFGIACYSSAPSATSPGLPQESSPGTPSTTPSTIEVGIEGFAFKPAEINVPVGSTITWDNKDSATHTMTARDKMFDSGSLSGGTTFSYLFGEKGTFEYYCLFHPAMTGKVIVE